LAFLESSLLSCHFWPFTDVQNGNQREVTTKCGNDRADCPDITDKGKPDHRRERTEDSKQKIAKETKMMFSPR
jgi:hypothetical protein